MDHSIYKWISLITIGVTRITNGILELQMKHFELHLKRVQCYAMKDFSDQPECCLRTAIGAST